jgi:hypothetical protein
MLAGGWKESSASTAAGPSQSAHKSGVGAMSSRRPLRRTLGATPTYTSVRRPIRMIVRAAAGAWMPMKKRARSRPGMRWRTSSSVCGGANALSIRR